LRFAKSLSGVAGAALGGVSLPASLSAQAPAAAASARAAGRLAPAKVTRIRLFYPPNYDRKSNTGQRLHALGAIDLALRDIKGKALGAPLHQLFGGRARKHIEPYKGERVTANVDFGFVRMP
jgi:L-alanine-DL-glutamate epimerase-like enolase superfamily enzyme